MDPELELGSTNPRVAKGDWSGAAPTFGDAPAPEVEEQAAADAHDAEIQARIEKMGPQGIAVAAMLASITLDGDRVRCEQMGLKWPGVSDNPTGLQMARELLTQAWTETLAMIWPRTNSKYSSPMLAGGALVGGKVLVVVAAKQSGGRRVVVDAESKETPAPKRGGRVVDDTEGKGGGSWGA